jgi:hypothetical protein
MGVPAGELAKRLSLRELVDHVGYDRYVAALQNQAIERIKAQRAEG